MFRIFRITSGDVDLSSYNNNQDVYPWKVSQSGAVWCKWQNLPNDISVQLKMENGFTKTIDTFSYRVKRNDDGGYIVFKNPPRNYRYASTRTSVDGAYREIQVLPLEEANKLLADSNQFEFVTVKVVGQQFFVVLGKKENVQ
jgi:hypothetical protein